MNCVRAVLKSACSILSGTFAFEWVFQRFGDVDLAHRSSLPPFLAPSQWLRVVRRRGESSSVYFSHSRGRYFALLFGILVHACWYAMMGSKRGYICLLLAFVVSGIGRAFMFGVLNSYVAALPSKPLGQLHGSWGIGGFCSPLVAQAMISSGIDWHIFYLISLAWSALAIGAAVLTFRPTRQERASELASAVNVSPSSDSVESGLPSGSQLVTPTKSRSTLLLCFKSPLILAYCAFLFVYSGSETSANGFVRHSTHSQLFSSRPCQFVTYLLRERHANPKAVGYFGSVFWAGFTIARLLVGYWAPRHSYRAGKLLEHLLMLSALCWNLCIWLVPSLPANVAFVGCVGLSVGPMFPLTVHLATTLIPTELHMVGIALLSASASFGSAILPFVSGVLSNNPNIGLDVLPKMLVAEGSILLIAWFFFPRTA
ncbi:MFS general substrate transporter [Exidia glandulosa HHB12029]|uniref:MFS general substrate transporter n=1 Tax=Exidia glandulosa HHB12029 TaxID=1314781 RepID=A0A165PGL8_EXIGL|nr:MFS general substrate transporter [Exidia glandulosa HHB12029]